MASAENDVGELSFEAALSRLEEIVRTLEKGEAPLDQSITLYQEGDRLRRHCEARLKDAQARIEQIAFGAADVLLTGSCMNASTFDILAASAWHDDQWVPSYLVFALARAAGPSSMAGGQMMDLAGARQQLDLTAITRLQ